MKTSLARIRALTKRNLKELLRDPLSLIFLIATPLVMEVLFYWFFHAKADQFQMRYLAPGIVVFSQSFLCLFSGLLISIDRNSSFLTRLYVSSARAHEFIIGYALSILPLALLQSVFFFLVGGALDASIFSFSMIAAIFLSLIPSLFFLGVGILFGSLCPEKAMGGIASIIISGHSFLSGVWYPIDDFSNGMIAFMNALPFRPASVLVQNALNGAADPFQDFWMPLLIVLSYTLVTFFAAIFAFRSKMIAK